MVPIFLFSVARHGSAQLCTNSLVYKYLYIEIQCESMSAVFSSSGMVWSCIRSCGRSLEPGAWSLEPRVRTTSRSKGKCKRRTRSRSWISNWKLVPQCNRARRNWICSKLLRIWHSHPYPHPHPLLRYPCCIPFSIYISSCLQFVVFEHAKMRFGLHSPNILDPTKFSTGLLCCLRFSPYFCRFFLPFFLGPELWQIFMQCCMSSDLPWWHADGISGTGQAGGACTGNCNRNWKYDCSSCVSGSLDGNLSVYIYIYIYMSWPCRSPLFVCLSQWFAHWSVKHKNW